MKHGKPKPDRRQQTKMRVLKGEIDDCLLEAYLGPCPVCRGNVFGSLDEHKCRNCGWTNDETFSERRGAA